MRTIATVALSLALATLAACGDSAGGSCVDDVGVTHANGESWDASDGCNTCSCDHGSVMCTEMGCIDTDSDG